MKVLKLFCLGLFFALTQPAIANDELIIVKGKILSEKFLQEVFDELCNYENIICMKGPYHFSIKVEETLVGSSPVRLDAVEYIHGGRFYSGSEDYLFVLERIKDDKKRELLKVDFLIKEVVSRSLDYCFSKPINEYLKEDFIRESFSDKCYRNDAVFKQIKYRALDEIGDKLIERLKSEGELVDFDYLQLDLAGKIYSSNKDEYVEDTCTDEDISSFDVDRWKACGTVEGVTEVMEFQVTKGTSSQVIMLINNEIERLPFKNLKSEFTVDTKDDVAIVRWFYEVL